MHFLPHPFFAHFPIVLFIFAFVLQVLSLKHLSLLLASKISLTSGVLMLAVTFFSGYYAWESSKVSDKVINLISIHHTWGRGLLIFSFFALSVSWADSVASSKKTVEILWWSSLVTNLILIAGCAVAGSLGGELVFNHGVGAVIR